MSVLTIHEDKLNEENFYDLFAELDGLEPFDIKKEELAAQLVALLSYTKKTRSDFAQMSGWQKSSVTAVLNGKRNPTFKTLWEFARCLGYEADLIFRSANELPAHQPWQPKKYNRLEIQAVEKVALDIKNGCHYDCYIGFNIEPMFITTMEVPKTTTPTKYVWFEDEC
jgi:transcriptional regulator with XRE-family HTH domain